MSNSSSVENRIEIFSIEARWLRERGEEKRESEFSSIVLAIQLQKAGSFTLSGFKMEQVFFENKDTKNGSAIEYARIESGILVLPRL